MIQQTPLLSIPDPLLFVFSLSVSSTCLITLKHTILSIHYFSGFLKYSVSVYWNVNAMLILFCLLAAHASDQISHSVVSNSLRPHESQHARPPCPSPAPGVHSDSRPSSQWCHPAISSSVLHAKLLQSSTLCDSMDSRLLAWRLLCPWEFSREDYSSWLHALFRVSSQPKDQTRVSCGSCVSGGFFTAELPGKPWLHIISVQ